MKTISKNIAASAILLCACTGAYAQDVAYHVAQTFHIASSGGWDYIAVSPVGNNLYVSHRSQVNILDKRTGDSVGVIANTDGVHGIAFAAGYKKGFTSNGKLNTVTVFDINTNAVQDQVKMGENPDAIMYDPYLHKVYVCNGHSNDLTIIDPQTNKVTATVALGGKPETAVTDEAGNIYVNIEDKNEIVVVATNSCKVTNRWKVGKGDEPAGLAIDIKTKRLFAGCGNKLLVVMDYTTGKVVKELPIGSGCDGVAFDPELKYIFASNGEGTLTVIKEERADKYTVAGNVPTKKGARTLAVDQATHKVYLPTADFEPQAAADKGKRPAMVPGTFQVLVISK